MSATMTTKTLKQVSSRVPAAAARPTATSATVQVKKPMVLTRVEKLGLLSKLEKAGVLSALESAGITLEFIEKNQLLSKAEAAGVVRLLSDRGTPTTLLLGGIALILAAGATIAFVPDDNSSLVFAQTAGAATLGAVALASILGGVFVAELQKDKALW